MIDLGSKIQELKDLMGTVPFGNSEFQIRNFVMQEPTPERRYVKALIQIHSKLSALEVCKEKQDLLRVEIEEIEIRLKRWMSKFKRKKLEIELESKKRRLRDEMKFVEDAVYEVSIYKSILDTLPVITREQFEKAEFGYWKERLVSDAKFELISSGKINKDTLQTLEKIGIIHVDSLGKELPLLQKISELEQKPEEKNEVVDGRS